ncbi:MAG: hypothetical protein PHE17_17895 [Thiothrix sp.]|nr:hypothetical protein [Thiothrix sp.]MDD5394893.1 hypothetical protein [Thiothrix sp.]
MDAFVNIFIFAMLILAVGYSAYAGRGRKTLPPEIEKAIDH